MTEIKPEYKIKRMPGNGKKERFFPVKVTDNEKLLDFVAKYIKFPLSQGVNQILIHSTGDGVITGTEEKRMNR